MENILRELSVKAEKAGFRVTPVYLTGKTQPYANSQSYPYDQYPELWRGAKAVGVVLDDHVLCDWDNNKPNAIAPSLEELQVAIGSDLPIPFQGNEKGTSLHFVFQLPKCIDKSTLYHSRDGIFMKGVDLKTGNQLMHIKTVASDGSPKWQIWSELNEAPIAPHKVVEALRKPKIMSANLSPVQFDGTADPNALRTFQQRITQFSVMLEGQDGGRNNELNNLALQWFSIAYSGDLDHAFVEAELRKAAALNGCEGIDDTLKSAKSKALKQPRKHRTIPSARAVFGNYFQERDPLLPNIHSHASYLEEPIAASSSEHTPFVEHKLTPQLDLVSDDVPDAITLLNSAFAHRLKVNLGIFYWWTGREWQALDNSVVRKSIGLLYVSGHKKTTQSRVKGVLEAMRDHADQLSELNPPVPRVYFVNGVLNVPLGEFVPHDPKNGNTRTLTVNYEPCAGSPLWLEWLTSIFETEQERIALLQELMGWLICRNHFGIEKALLFIGPPRAGKGVISRILHAIQGDAATTFSFAEMDNYKMLSAMRGKNVAIDADAVSANSRNGQVIMGLFKRITSDDRITMPLLYTQTPWEGALSCKLLILANSVPLMWDDSAATANRWIPLMFDRSYLGKEDPKLFARLSQELSGITAWAASGLMRLVQRGNFELPRSSLDQLEILVSDGGSIQNFIEECLHVGEDLRCTDISLWKAYQVWALPTHHAIGKRYRVIKSLEDALRGRGVRRVKSIKLDDGRTYRGFHGLNIASPKTPSNVSPVYSNPP